MYGRRVTIGCLLLLLTTLVPAVPPRTASAAQPDICGPALDRWVVAPEDRAVRPVAIERADANGGRVENPDGLLAAGGAEATLERVSGSDPTIILDFGKVVSGQVRITTGASNQPPLRIAASESLQFLTDDGDVDWGDQRSYGWQPARAGDEYLSGQLTFRYLMLYLAGNGRVDIDDVVLEFTPFLGTSDTFAGCFESSDDLLNRIWYAGAYTLELNTVSQSDGETLILDGAKRDRAVWIGDLAVAARMEYATHNQPDGIRDSLAAMADRQRPDGTIPPSSFLDGSLIMYDYYAWWVTTFAEYYLYTGDAAFARTYYAQMQRQLDWFTGRIGPNGLIQKDAGIEWAFTLGRNGEVTYINAVYYNALLQAAQLADALGHGDHAASWRARAASIKQAINARLWDAGRGVYVDSDLDRNHVPQDGNALAVLYGIASPEQARTVLDYLQRTMWTPFGATNVDVPYGTNLIHDKRIWPFMGYFEVEARFAAGDDARAYDLLRREWGQMLNSDPASTMWEWMRADGSIENGFTSLAHAWSGGVTASLTEHTLGIQRTGPQFATFDAIPSPGDVGWAKGRVPTSRGNIDVSWTASDGVFAETLTVPGGSRARAGVPLLGRQPVVQIDGRVVWDGRGSVGMDATNDGRYVYVELGPGTHRLESISDAYYFPETGYILHGVFKAFWERSGGVPVFGYPVSRQSAGVEIPTQYFERQRFEYHPENMGTDYEVLLGLLGSTDAERRGLLGTPAFQPAQPDPDPNCRYVPETGHNICDGFRGYWEQHGLELGDNGVSDRESLALFGYPISEEFIDPESGLTTQYFERAKFEFQPENPGPFTVLLGRLGASIVDRDLLKLTRSQRPGLGLIP
ncbi:MAG TPA: amylo-alpha-1,6-glucosidase [Thermomicrobiales bacterium]|nr:amylo-alpha-1,6-glucosidase [Thermomicrobiales bacterium]